MKTTSNHLICKEKRHFLGKCRTVILLVHSVTQHEDKPQWQVHDKWHFITVSTEIKVLWHDHSLALPYITDNPIYLNIVLYKIRYQGQATKFPTYESPICDLSHFMGKPSRNGNWRCLRALGVWRKSPCTIVIYSTSSSMKPFKDAYIYIYILNPSFMILGGTWDDQRVQICYYRRKWRVGKEGHLWSWPDSFAIPSSHTELSIWSTSLPPFSVRWKRIG